MRLNTVKKIFLLVLIVLLVLTMLNFTKIRRLSKVLNLFKPEYITQNFYSMDTIFPTNKIAPSLTPFVFEKGAEITLPESFTYKGKKWEIKEYIKETETTGLLIISEGQILYEKYYKGYSEDKNHISWSLSKSIVSAMIGIAIDEGMIKSIEDPVDQYVPMLEDSGYGGVSLKDVLQMSTGIKFDEDYHSFNSDINKLGRVFALGNSLDKYVSSLSKDREPGTFHNYVSMDTQVLGMVLKSATKMDLSVFLEKYIWKPMGAEHSAYWLKDDTGMEAAFGGLNCSLRDYGRIGWMYANEGKINGVQIVPSAWVKESTEAKESHLLSGDIPTLSSHPYGYGYQWWIPNTDEAVFVGMGIYNQYIYVDPINNIVIIKNSANHNYAIEKRETTFRHLTFLNSIREEIIAKK